MNQDEMLLQLSIEGDDYRLTRILQEKIKLGDSSYAAETKAFLRYSNDGIFRSVCLEYLKNFNLVDEEDVITGLCDAEFSVRSIALDCAENFDSEIIIDELIKLVLNDSEDFIVAWAIVVLSFHEYEDINTLQSANDTWFNSELVKMSIAFHQLYVSESTDCLTQFLNGLHSDSHLVRGFVINLCQCLSHLNRNEIIISAIEHCMVSESYVFLKEAMKESLDNIIQMK